MYLTFFPCLLRPRFLEIENQGPTGILSRYEYGYDALDRRTNVLLHAGDYWDYDYNTRSEVTNAVRRWSDNVPVLGQTFGYGYDDIGNRETSSRDEDTSAYGANDLNQYTNRTVPGVAHVLGTASTDADVWINMDAADRARCFHAPPHPALLPNWEREIKATWPPSSAPFQGGN